MTTRLTVLVTRPAAQAGAWVQRLQAQGLSAQAFPLLRIVEQPQAREPIAALWQALATQRLLMFVSPSAVAAFFAGRPAGAAWPAPPGHTLAGATGPGTVAALRAQGLAAGDIAAPPADAASFDTDTLWQQRLAALDWRGARVTVVRGEGGRDWLADTLAAAGATVDFLPAYRQLGPAWTAEEGAALDAILAAPEGHAWLYGSSQAAAHLWDEATRRGQAAALARCPALCTHPRIAASARRLGHVQVVEVRPEPAEVAAAVQGLQAPA